MNLIDSFTISAFVVLSTALGCADCQCETTSHQNRNGFCTADEFCCKGFAVSNLCTKGGVCCYGSYDCTSDSNPTGQQSPNPCPPITSRLHWKARNPTKMIASIAPADHIFIHHTDDGNTCYTDKSCLVRLRSLQSYHQLSKGWTDIAWNFLIGGNGIVYEGLGWNREGFHTLHWNHNSIGIALIGNFNDEYPTNEMLDSLQNLITCGLRNGFIRKNYRIHGHRDVRKTSCPGDNLYRYVSGMTNFQTPALIGQPTHKQKTNIKN